MDRNFFYQKRTQEYQREISQELASRHLHGGVGEKPLSGNRVKRLVLRVEPFAIVISLLLLLAFFG